MSSAPLLAAAVAAVAVSASLSPRTGDALVLINESPSLPRGLYLRRDEPVVVGSVVAFAQPAEVRPYLQDLGMPPEVRLLKRVAAQPGDVVCADGKGVQVAGRRIAARALDRRGRRLPARRGCRALVAGELFVLGDTADSFDSRYFGPVRRADVMGPYQEVLRW